MLSTFFLRGKLRVDELWNNLLRLLRRLHCGLVTGDPHLSWTTPPSLRSPSCSPAARPPGPPVWQVDRAGPVVISSHSLLFLGNYRSLPVFQLLELVLNENVKILDFSKNRDWIESEEMNEFARILWKIVGEKCRVLEKFIIPKELTYSSTLNSVIGEKYSARYPTFRPTAIKQRPSGSLFPIIILDCFQWMDPVCTNWLWRETFLTTCFSTISVSTVPTYKEGLITQFFPHSQ